VRCAVLAAKDSRRTFVTMLTVQRHTFSKIGDGVCGNLQLLPAGGRLLNPNNAKYQKKFTGFLWIIDIPFLSARLFSVRFNETRKAYLLPGQSILYYIQYE